jgi:hypothetical protein
VPFLVAVPRRAHPGFGPPATAEALVGGRRAVFRPHSAGPGDARYAAHAQRTAECTPVAGSSGERAMLSCAL